MANGPFLLGSPRRTAGCPPAGKTGGGGPYLTSAAEMVIASGLEPALSLARAAPVRPRAQTDTTSIVVLMVDLLLLGSAAPRRRRDATRGILPGGGHAVRCPSPPWADGVLWARQRLSGCRNRPLQRSSP